MWGQDASLAGMAMGTSQATHMEKLVSHWTATFTKAHDIGCLISSNITFQATAAIADNMSNKWSTHSTMWPLLATLPWNCWLPPTSSKQKPPPTSPQPLHHLDPDGTTPPCQPPQPPTSPIISLTTGPRRMHPGLSQTFM